MTSVDVLRQQSLNSAVTTSCTRCYQTPFPSPYSNRGLACETNTDYGKCAVYYILLIILNAHVIFSVRQTEIAGYTVVHTNKQEHVVNKVVPLS